MRLELTARPLRAELKRVAKRMFRRACEDLGVSLASIADHLDVAHGVAERWAREDVDHPLPVWALASRRAIPEALYQRILADIDALRAQQPDGVRATAEGAASLLIVRAGSTLEEIGRSLADGRITSLEAPAVRRRVSDLRAQCDALLRALDHVDDRRAS